MILLILKIIILFFAKVPDNTSSFFAKFANTTCFDQFCAEAAYKTA